MKLFFKRGLSLVLSIALVLGATPLIAEKASAADLFEVKRFLPSTADSSSWSMQALTTDGKVINMANNTRTASVYSYLGIPDDIKVEDFALASWGGGVIKDTKGRVWAKGAIPGSESPDYVTKEWAISVKLKDIDLFYIDQYSLQYTKKDGTFWMAKGSASVATNYVIPDTTGIKQIQSNPSQSYVLMNSGDVYVKGRGDYSGIASMEGKTIDAFMKVPNLPKIKKISTSSGSYSTLALAENGDTYGWGIALPVVNFSSNNTSKSPRIFTELPKAKDIAAGFAGSLVLTEDSKLYGYDYMQDLFFKQSSGYSRTSFIEYDVVDMYLDSPIKELYMSGRAPYIVTESLEMYSWGPSGPDTWSKVSAPSKINNISIAAGVSKPSAPANFGATTTANSIDVSWGAVPGAEKYILTLDGAEVYTGVNLNYTVSGLLPNKVYTLDVKALNKDLSGDKSTIQVTTKPEEKPASPSNLKAETTSNSAIISWDAVIGANSYRVILPDDKVYTGQDTTVTVRDLKPNSMYTVYVSAVKRAENNTIEGDRASLQFSTKEEEQHLNTPSNLIATPHETAINLTWDAVEGATDYIVKRGNTIVYQGPLTTFYDSGLVSGSLYGYSVVAIKGSVKSETALVETTTLVSQLAYPANLRITTLEYNKVRLDWDVVEGADEYLITRDGMTIGVPRGTWWSEDSDDIYPGATYTYQVNAIKNGVNGKVAQKVVTVPTEPIPGEKPSGDLALKATRVYHDRVGLSWTAVTGATHYAVYQDDVNKVWTGELNTITDSNVGAEENHTYKVVAGNQYGSLESNVINITTPAAPQSIVITPSQPLEGTITFDFKVVDGAMHYVERNPQTRYEPVGDGTYHKTYYNSATGETRDEGIVTPVNGKLNFSENGVDPGKDYHYEITAVVTRPDGSEEVVGEEKVEVTTPADGSGVTVPGTVVDPETPTDPGTGNGGGNTNPGTDNGSSTYPGAGSGNGGNTGGGNTGGGNTGGGNTGGGNTGEATGSEDTGSGNGGTKPSTDNGTGPDEATNTGEVPKHFVEFTDLENSFAKEAIEYLAEKGIVKGYVDGTFNPNKKVTRAEFAILLTRSTGYKDASFTDSFTDFDSNAWYAKELSTALYNGVTKGFTDGTYRPNVVIPREQAAVMLSNILSMRGKTEMATLSYTDSSDIIAWAKDSVSIATNYEVMGGYPSGKFMPKRELTRAEAAVMIYNLLTN
jgi:hypothetical protein